MTRTHLASLLLSVSAMLALAGCGGGGLLVSGNALVTDSAGTTTGFRFPSGIRLDGPAGTTTGTCTITRTNFGYGAVVDLYGDARAEGHTVRSVSILAHTPAGATDGVTADLGGDEFTGQCDFAITSVDEAQGNITLNVSDCALAHGTETATASVSLSLAGCTVL